MSVYEDFINTIKKTDTDFEIRAENRTLKFHQIRDDKLKFVYAGELNKPYVGLLDLEFYAVAVIKGDTIYLYKDSCLPLTAKRLIMGEDGETKIAGVCDFDDTKDNLYGIISDIMEEYIKTTKTTYVLNEDDKDYYGNRAREAALLNKPAPATITYGRVPLSNQDLIDVLQEKITPEDLMKRTIEDKGLYDDYLKRYACKNYYDSLVRNYLFVAKDWELRLVAACKNNAKTTVVAEFEMDGKRASGKMSADRILAHLVYHNNMYIERYNFISKSEGDKVVEALGVNYNNKMYLDDLVSLKYRGKIIYQKDERK